MASQQAPRNTNEQLGTSSVANSVLSGRWLMWHDRKRTRGTFVTAEGMGPKWPLDVEGRGVWSNDGRWLTSCASGFVAARFMGSARPSRIGVFNGGCLALRWMPRKDTALVLSPDSKQLRILSFTPGDEPTIQGTTYKLTLAEGESLDRERNLEWSPTGNGFLVDVSAPKGGWSVRWVDTVRQPGTVHRLVTKGGFEAEGQCWWAPNGRRLACRVVAPSVDKDPRHRPPEALGLYELSDGGISGRLLFEARFFQLKKLNWLNDDYVVWKDSTATRVLEVNGAVPPSTLSATSDDFAVSPTAARVAYVNHRGLCLRTTAGRLGPEQVLIEGKVGGVDWSSDGRHLLTQRADQHNVLVVTDVGEKRKIHEVKAPVGLELAAMFSEKGDMLLARAGSETKAERLRTWSLPYFTERQLLPTGFDDHSFLMAPDGAAVILNSEGKAGSPKLGLIHESQVTTLQSLGETISLGATSWQPGPTIAVSERPDPPKLTDPKQSRITLPADHPISLGTAYVAGSLGCTGALIDPYYVVTAHHCVDNARGPVKITLGRNMPWERTFEVPPFRIISHPAVHYVARLDLFEYDLAVAELPTPAPPQARPFEVAQTAEGAPGVEVFLAGYGGDHSVGLNGQPELRYGTSQLVASSNGLAQSLRWRSAAGAENGGCFGDSGGPILVRRSNRTFALLGIHYGTETTDYTQVCRNQGVAGDLSTVRDWLNDALDKLAMSRRGSGLPRPRAKRL